MGKITFNCDNCGVISEDRPSHFARKTRHFCSRQCYSIFRRDKMPKEEQHRFGTGLSSEERMKRRRARTKLNHYLRDKKMVRPNCEICGNTAEAHHEDYDRPLDVRWLCFKHHREAHKTYENPELLK